MSGDYEPGVRDALHQARQLLSSVNSPDGAAQESGGAERILECAFRLLESVYTTIGSGKSMTLTSSDSTVVKAILELVVRWGIYPHLSPGVGIPLEKRFGEKSAASAAAALREHFKGHEQQGSSSCVQASSSSSHGAPTSLLQSAELLAGLILDSSQKQTSDMDLIKSDGESEPPLTQATQLPAATLHQLFIFHHLPDLCAAFLQLSVSGKEEWKKLATERMQEMVYALPVAHMVEALLTLLGQGKPEPPTWLKEKAGRMLSKLLLREGGVAASMERLVGGIQEGNVKAYEHIAVHLAKIPRYITTTQGYYEAVCPQLPPLFLSPLPGQEGGLKEGTSAARLVVNMHHTAIIMACRLASRDVKLCETYLLTPLLKPLLHWGTRILECEPDKCSYSQSEGTIGDSEEIALVNAVIGTHIFLTAGHDGAENIREFLVSQLAPITEPLNSLKILLEPKRSVSKPKHVKQGAAQTSLKPSFERGFLENRSLGYHTAEGPSSILDRLRAALSDIMETLQEGHSESVSCSVLKVEWPRHEGDIWLALNSDK